MKRALCFLLSLCIIGSIVISCSDSCYGYTYSYTYSYDSNGTVTDVLSPTPYIIKKIYDHTSLGVALQSPEDIAVDNEGNFYIVDSISNEIYIFNSGFVLQKTISGYEKDGETKKFNAPTGIFIDDIYNMYIADSLNKQIVVLNSSGKWLKSIYEPQSDLLPDTFSFIPQKVAVDEAGRVFVLVKNVFEGLMQFSTEGNFIGFIGSNKVVITMADLIWKTIMTKQQQEQLVSFIPVEYTNISMDDSGFMYAVTSVKNVNTPIRRLNSSGDDILIRTPLDGSQKVVGDVLYPDGVGDDAGPSSFVDITQDDRGNYYALDGKRGRIFTYDEEGNLLFVFGGIGSKQEGSFINPSSLLYLNGNLYIVDKGECTISEFTPTEYTSQIHAAIKSYLQQDYKDSILQWNQVIKRNSNFSLGYMKVGYAYYRLSDYKQAMKYFKIANAKSAYSKAYVKDQKQLLNANFTKISLICLAVILILFIAFRWLKKRVS